MDPETTTVRIFGREYSIRSENDPEYVRRVAALVDEKMREVSTASSQVTSVRVAILASLNLADEVLQQDPGNATARELEESILSGELPESAEAEPKQAEAEGS